jgi:hypothetical protein
MESSRDERLTVALSSLRPTPRPEFAAELDERAAAGFPRRTGQRGSPLGRLAARLRATSPRRFALPAGGVALAALTVVTAIVASNHSRSGPVADNPLPKVPSVSGSAGAASAGTYSSRAAEEVLKRSNGAKLPQRGVKVGGACEKGTAGCSGSGEFNGDFFGEEAGSAAGTSGETMASSKATAGAVSGPYASQAHHRDVERSAEMVLGAEPADVGEDSAKVFEAVHAVNGIVLSSSTRGGPGGDAGAGFDLMIPSARLNDALASFSGIGEVVSKHEATNDITAPTIGLSERLQDSNAKIEGLLNELAGSETAAERDAAEAELRAERNRAARLRSSLSGIQRRASFSRVSLRIETGGSASTSGGGNWDVGNALHDAGHILTISAGVTIVGLAILGPLALVCLLLWLANRTWVRRSRERTLG